MKILLATDTSLTFVCGGTSLIERTTAALAKRGHEVRIICPSRSRATETYETAAGVPVYGVGSISMAPIQQRLRIVLPFGGAKADIHREVRSFRPDVVHLHSHFFLASMILKESRSLDIPVIETNHVMPENFTQYVPMPRIIEHALVTAGWRQLHRVLDQLDAVTTPTETAARYLRASGFPKPVRAISNGVNLCDFNPGVSAAGVRRKYLLPDKPLLLYVGRLDPEKNVCDLLRALPYIRERADVHLVVVGRGARESALRKQVARLSIGPHVTFTRFVPNDDLPHLYRLATCFLMPGTAELQSIATMEAMASGLPIIAADAMALPELVHDGENGYLFPPHRSRAIAKKTIAVLENEPLRQQMGAKSTDIVRVHHIDHTIDRFLELYRSVQQGEVRW